MGNDDSTQAENIIRTTQEITNPGDNKNDDINSEIQEIEACDEDEEPILPEDNGEIDGQDNKISTHDNEPTEHNEVSEQSEEVIGKEFSDSDLSLDGEESGVESEAEDENNNIGLSYDDTEDDNVQENNENGKDDDEGELVIENAANDTEGMTTIRSGRAVKQINYKSLSNKGSQFHQSGYETKGSVNQTQTKIRIHDMYRRVTAITMMNVGKSGEYDQLGVKAGIKKHGEAAVAATIKNTNS